jgi:hypothetical protein
MNRIISLVSFSACSMSYFAAVFIRSKSLLVESLESSKYKIILSANRDNLDFLPFYLYPFFSLVLLF